MYDKCAIIIIQLMPMYLPHSLRSYIPMTFETHESLSLFHLVRFPRGNHYTESAFSLICHSFSNYRPVSSKATMCCLRERAPGMPRTYLLQWSSTGPAQL